MSMILFQIFFIIAVWFVGDQTSYGRKIGKYQHNVQALHVISIDPNRVPERNASTTYELAIP